MQLAEGSESAHQLAASLVDHFEGLEPEEAAADAEAVVNQLASLGIVDLGD